MTTNDFTASNGDTIETRPDGYLVVKDDRHTEWVNPLTAGTLREYFQHQRDQELGRWRSKNHPDYVVHALPDQPGAIDITNERSTASHRCFEDCSHLGVDTFKWGAVKDEYFAAHPELKPWRDAHPGDVWLLNVKNRLERDLPALVNADGEFVTAGTLYNLGNPDIVHATRIWPEESDDE